MDQRGEIFPETGGLVLQVWLERRHISGQSGVYLRPHFALERVLCV